MHIDAAGQAIKNPIEAIRDYRNVLVNGFKWENNYKDFAGFYYVPDEGLKTGKAPPPKLLPQLNSVTPDPSFKSSDRISYQEPPGHLRVAKKSPQSP